MIRRSLAGQALRHRWGQALVLVVLSGLITAAAVIGPLYERAVHEAVVRNALNRATVSQLGLSSHANEQGDVLGPHLLLPRQALSLYGPDVEGQQASIGMFYRPSDLVPVTIASRANICDHLTFAQGSCPSDAGSVAVSVDTARLANLRPGAKLAISVDPQRPGQHAPVQVVVSGVYQRFDPATEYWFDHPYVTPVPAIHDEPDTILTAFGDVDPIVKQIQDKNGALVAIDRFTDIPLKSERIHVAEIARLQAAIESARALAQQDQAVMDTSLDAILNDVEAAQGEVHDVVPLFAAELVLLALALLMFVMGSAAAQRRPEVALARLRGQSPRRAAWLLVSELSVPALVGVPAGAAFAALALELARAVWLPPGVPFAVPASAWQALAAAAGVQLLVIVVAALRMVREPVVTLLRRVGSRTLRVRLGPLEVAAGTLAVAGVLTVVSSGLSGPVAILAPGVLALAVGLLVGVTVPVVAARLGPRALQRGSVRTGLGALQMARRTGTRGAFVLLVVSVSALVLAADCWHVAAENRTARAGREVGAPAVLHVSAASMHAVEAAAAKLDPTGKRVVEVAKVVPPNVGVSVLAMRPAAAAAVAPGGWSDDRPAARAVARLEPPLPPTITLTGGSVDVRLSSVTVRGAKPPHLALDVVGVDGMPVSYDLGALRPSAKPVDLRRPVPCTEGCRVQGITVQREFTDGDPQLAQVDLAAITAYPGAAPVGRGTPLALGTAKLWRGSTAAVTKPDESKVVDEALDNPGVDMQKALDALPSYGVTSVTAAPGGSGVRLRSYSAGSQVGLAYGDVPLRIPALTVGVLADPGQDANTFSAGRLDGLTQSFVSVGDIAAVPGLPGRSALVDLDLLARLADSHNSGTSYEVWLAEASSANVLHQRAGLARLGVTTTKVETLADRERQLGDSGAVWSLRLALLTGLAALVAAAAVLVIGVSTTVRGRRYDVAALQVSGVPRRLTAGAALGELLALSLLASIVGAACGVVGARLLFRTAPYLAGGAGFDGARVFTAWPLAVLVWLVAVAGLVVVSALCARFVVDGARPGLVRESAS
ncbi:MAG: FtsX-like permease family protein [Actinomycetales bacterium]